MIYCDIDREYDVKTNQKRKVFNNIKCVKGYISLF